MFNNGNFDIANTANTMNTRLTFEQLQQRRQQLQQEKANARKVGTALAMLDPTEGVASVASAEDIGDVCQYRIEDRVNLPRQKSAMLPIISQTVEGEKVSIYNESVHAKFPLLGLRYRIAGDQPLMQGPVTVYDGPGYAGDSRLPDLQAGEERLLSYAVDTGTEVSVENPVVPEQLSAVKAVKGVLYATHRLRRAKTYLVKNRSTQDRTLVIEHPHQDGWRLVTPQAATERSRDVYRFQFEVKAGQALRHEVVEEANRVDRVQLSAGDDKASLVFLRSPVVGPKLKEALATVRDQRGRLVGTQRELAQAQELLKAIVEDQTRLRANFEKVPPSSAAYKRYLEKFDAQETEIERLQADIKARQATAQAQQKELEEFIAGLSLE
jgi:hypothetical protein